jgi:hypothetical protein
MKRFIVIDKKTKRLLREGQCSDEAFEAQAISPNEQVLDPCQCIKRTYVEIVVPQEINT